MRTIYIAVDNKEFDNEFECERYEWLLKHPHLKNIKCYRQRWEFICRYYGQMIHIIIC